MIQKHTEQKSHKIQIVILFSGNFYLEYKCHCFFTQCMSTLIRSNIIFDLLVTGTVLEKWKPHSLFQNVKKKSSVFGYILIHNVDWILAQVNYIKFLTPLTDWQSDFTCLSEVIRTLKLWRTYWSLLLFTLSLNFTDSCCCSFYIIAHIFALFWFHLSNLSLNSICLRENKLLYSWTMASL